MRRPCTAAPAPVDHSPTPPWSAHGNPTSPLMVSLSNHEQSPSEHPAHPVNPVHPCKNNPLTTRIRTYILQQSRQTAVSSPPDTSEAGFQHRRPTPSVKIAYQGFSDCQRLLGASPAWSSHPSVSHNAPCCVAYPRGWSMWATENTGHKSTCVPPAVL